MRPTVVLSPDPGASGAPIGAPIGQAPPAAHPGRPPDPPPPKIQSFEQKMGVKRGEESWKRTTNSTGQGATHVRCFHCKLGDDGLAYLDQQVNDWLDAHPQYEVKFSTMSVGEWTGKLGKEVHLIVQVWV
jgi:hypothetical protein